MDRLRPLSRHLSLSSDVHAGRSSEPPQRRPVHTGGGLPSPSPSDVVICCAVRTAIGKAGRGAIRKSTCEELLVPLFQEIQTRTGINPELVGDICIGNVLQAGAGAMSSRIAQALAGWPASSALYTTNRQCASGLQAIANIASSIQAGWIDVGVGGGIESMSQYDMNLMISPEKLSQRVFDCEAARNCLTPMGITSENVAKKYGISRETQDLFAVESHRRASAAQKSGLFSSEIVAIPVSTDEGVIRFEQDEGIRPTTTIEGLSKLRPSFDPSGHTTAGNSSQVSDGSALVLLARRAQAERLGLPILAKWM